MILTEEAQHQVSEHACRSMAFRFLDLPAGTCSHSLLTTTSNVDDPELRNYVYHFAATNDAPVRITHRKTPRGADTHGDVELPPTHNGLTRVCRHIRQEYRPLYRRTAFLEIDWKDLPKFLTTFCDAPEDDEAPCRELQVVLQNRFRLPIKTSYADVTPVNILPLLGLRVKSSDFDCRFVPSKAGLDRHSATARDCEGLNELYQHSHPEWLKDIRGGFFNSIVVHREGRGVGEIHIAFERENEAHLRRYSKGVDQDLVSASKDYLDAVGFEDGGSKNGTYGMVIGEIGRLSAVPPRRWTSLFRVW